MPEGTLGDEGRRPCTDMVDQRSQTNMAMVLHLLQDRLTKATCLNSGGTDHTISHDK